MNGLKTSSYMHRTVYTANSKINTNETKLHYSVPNVHRKSKKFSVKVNETLSRKLIPSLN